MSAKDAKNIVDSAVPKSPEISRLREGEKKALELSEQAEHAHGPEREHLQDQAQQAAKNRKR
jgi:hypothetical protein